MKTPPVVHGSFTLERTYKAPPARVFAAWADIEMKARWFIGPPATWTLLERQLDLRAGGEEILHGQFRGGRVARFVARYHVVIPNERLLYVYDMWIDGQHFSVSLATVEFTATDRGGTRMTFTEQAAFFDGKDGTKSRQSGTAAHFKRISPVVEDPGEVVSSRVFDAPRERVFEAFSDPAQLAQWWGPKGFTNTFHEFDLRPGGAWRFVMHGPDGTDYQLTKHFVDVVPPERIVLQHVQPVHGFRMAMSFVEVGSQTLLVWRMRFESVEEAERVREFVAGANEENFDRLAVQLGTVADG